MGDMAAALGRIPSGIFILTASHEGKRTGMLASWVMQASFEPPMFTVAVRSDRYLAEWLRGGATVALCILSSDEKNMIAHFGRGFEPGQEAFEGVALVEEVAAVPVLADALGYLVGKVTGSLPTGDHTIFSVVIEGGKLLRGGQPMTHVRKDGMRY